MNEILATRIERYLDGLLSPEERAAFETDLEKDEALALEVRLHRAARFAVRVQGALDRRERLQQRSRRLLRARLWRWKIQDFLQETFTSPGPQGVLQPRWGRLALAGLSVLLFVAGLWWLLQTSPTAAEAPIAAKDSQVLFQEYFSPLKISATLGTQAEDDYARARQWYAQGQCTEALLLLEKALAAPDFGARPTALVLQGVCLLEAGRTSEALASLKQVSPTAKIPYQQAEWYSALAYLKAGQRSKAAEQLQRIAQQSRHLYRKEARAILGLK
jgi:tetratricopeptide (TPR) repeat protein